MIEISSGSDNAAPEDQELEMLEHSNLADSLSDSVQNRQMSLEEQPGPSSLSSSPKLSTNMKTAEIDHLVNMFDGQLSEKQITAIYLLSGQNYDHALQCLLEGPSLDSIVTIMNDYFETKPITKLRLDLNSAWDDLLAYYKSSKVNFDLRIRIALAGEIAIDTGGVRRQVYTQVFAEFAQNKHIDLFDGTENFLRPAVSAVARSSGLLKILGRMISHSVFQDGIGFPYLSPTCFWYLIGKEDMAIQYVSLEDLPADSASLITEVILHCFTNTI